MNDFAKELVKIMPDQNACVLELKNEIAGILFSVDPLEAMLRAMWYMRTICFLRGAQRSMPGEKVDEMERLSELDGNNALIVPEYLQSLLTHLPASGTAEVGFCLDREAAYAHLFDACEKLVEQSHALSIMELAEAFPEFSSDEEERAIWNFQLEAKFYESIRGRRYQVIEEEYLACLLPDQDNLIRGIYGIGADDVIEGVVHLRDSLIRGWGDLLEEARSLSDGWGVQDRASESSAVARQTSVDEKDIADKLFGASLYDVAKITSWPKNLIEDLSKPAFPKDGDSDFAFCIDPIGILPIRGHPFISIDGKGYCFCYANFLDNFYRAFYAALKRRSGLAANGDVSSGNVFITRWKENQTKAPEGAVANLLSDLLPGCQVYRNVFHPIDGIEYRKDASRESDLLIIFADCAIAVEVKGGAYCPTDPVEDPTGHVKAFKTLIEKAAKQAKSTIDYLQRCNGECPFFNKIGEVVAKVDAGRIREFFRLCVTVDDVNEFAARAEKLKFIDVEPGTVAISIDDLLVYRRYFDNPLVFIHYLVQRRRASQYMRLELNDELDHLGMYIDDNCYSVAVANKLEEVESERGYFHRVMGGSFREDLDEWFEAQYEKKIVEKPVQKSPQAFNQLIEALSREKDEYRRIIACMLLDLGSDMREQLAKSISVRSMGLVPENLMVGIPAMEERVELPICIFAAPVTKPNDASVMRAKAVESMLMSNKEEAVVLSVVYLDPQSIDKCEITYISASELTECDYEIASDYEEQIFATRLASYKDVYGHLPGRNELCPCGSGKKFKKCCGWYAG
ncbi:SEC-C metal-binding domain-containing protein [Eggerthella sinensis]|uniref:SEC-C metal-binding domain-containing protein n=1 Tax=Eggerthella sinensis TaxID=242230 RepID=UPI00266B9F32|nr:SEC-C metal-binding domain-containing protein [Eggerthella sinensis]